MRVGEGRLSVVKGRRYSTSVNIIAVSTRSEPSADTRYLTGFSVLISTTPARRRLFSRPEAAAYGNNMKSGLGYL